MSREPGIILEQGFYPRHAKLFAELISFVKWDESMKARKTASFGKAYDYSQMSYQETGIPDCLVDVMACLASRLNITFNNCLLNLYETGQNTMGFHVDDTKNLLPETGVAIVSLGSARTISFRSIDESLLVDYCLHPGSLLYMDATVQGAWKHAIRKQDGVGPRISLTWRAVQ